LQDAGKNLKLAGDNLIKAANAAGGEDNITVALARVDDPGAVPTRQPQAVRTISGDDAAAAGKVMDAILQELMNLTPPEEDTQKIPVAQSVAKKDGTKAGGTGSGLGRHRWLFWLFILAAGTVAVFFGGGDLFRPAEDQELSPGIPLGQSTEVEPARLIIDWGAKEVPGAVVYIDDLMRGVTADYQQPGMAVEPGLRHIRCVLESDTVLDSIINIRLGENRIFLFSSVP